MPIKITILNQARNGVVWSSKTSNAACRFPRPPEVKKSHRITSIPENPIGKFNFLTGELVMAKTRVNSKLSPIVNPTKLFLPSGESPSESFSIKLVFELIKGEETKISANLPPKVFDCQGNLEVSPL